MTASAAAAAALTSAQAQVAPPAPLPPPTDLTRPQAPLVSPAAPIEIHPGPGPQTLAGPVDFETDVSTISLDGVTAYPAGALNGFYGGLEHRKVRLSELFEVAAKIEARYRADGYVLTRVVVPVQSVADGHFHIRVIEGYVSVVEVTGDPGPVAQLVHRYLEKIGRRHPARLADIERYLLLVNDLPGVSARAVLTADPDRLGGAKLVVEVGRKPVEAFATFNNRGSNFAGPLTGTAGGAINGLGPEDGRIAGSVFTTFNSEQEFGQLELSSHFGDEGAAARVWASYGPSAPGSIFKPIDLRSRSTVVGVGASYPIIRSRGFDLNVQGSFEVSDDRTRILGTLISRDDMRVARVGLDGDYRDGWGGFSTWSATLHRGLDIAGASHDGAAIPQSRFGGRSDFTKLTATWSRLQPLMARGVDTVALQVNAAGQWAANNLLPLEQFHVGGQAFGRGYNPDQASGDNGAAADFELQFTHLAPIGPVMRHQLYAFFDAAAVRNRDLPVGWKHLNSYGAGVRADLGPRLSAQLEVAVPYDSGRLVGARRDTGAQVFFGLTARY